MYVNMPCKMSCISAYIGTYRHISCILAFVSHVLHIGTYLTIFWSILIHMDVILNVAPYCLRLSNVQKMSKSQAIYSNIIFPLHNMRNMSTICPNILGEKQPWNWGKRSLFPIPCRPQVTLFASRFGSQTIHRKNLIESFASQIVSKLKQYTYARNRSR